MAATMKLSLDSGTASYRIRAYGPGSVTIEDTVYTAPLILMPERVIPDWPVTSVTELTSEDFAPVLQYEPEIILLGTGTVQTFPDGSLMAGLARRHIGLEVMDTAAACRTYNILMAEDRRVAAALIMIRDA